MIIIMWYPSSIYHFTVKIPVLGETYLYLYFAVEASAINQKKNNIYILLIISWAKPYSLYLYMM